MPDEPQAPLSEQSSPVASSPRALTPDSGTHLGLALKDKVAIVLSAAALVVSLSTFYYTNVRVDDRLQARLAEFQVLPGDEKDNINSYINGYISGRFAISNAGNRTAIILNVEYTLNGTGRFEDGGFGAEVVSTDKLFPLVMQPRDIRILDLAIPVRYIVNHFEEGASSSNNATRSLFVAYRIKSLNSKGESFAVTSPYLAKIDVTKTGWQDLSYLKNTRYVPVDLFGNR